MNLPRVILDTNVYISGLLYGGNPLSCLELAREKKIRIFTSRAQILELSQKLYTKFDWKEDDIKKLIKSIGLFTELIEPKHSITLIEKDESDNRVLEIAKEIGADFIISGDKKHILPLKKFEGTKIISAADFIKQFTPEN
ncbi:putative toxin-antitoxin system toxin component, PIN family [Candidatus Woesebacteria bacterium RBG_19FT_COMBO_42_9]|uniref:Putative toxin-antitoxin system toxin component, PIN family n=1 Tax=Candidatus Woesebacteria bacterium RBG_16_42_24 TaxID=1802485 RepID=A0A1F7XJY4_9BACT|nr:MAG: putative toxin-antitoxin system toxin component, PIN family [Candidatus Woesebacteria bacterium RBG_16_42_24]OGM16413.1 MAG: putative toxin-antitoxin system toxin component, PIN family [Candidatus Woesebacteria bacterium RBG_19FT_COMBO_42_9]OGM67349.1 MAG: putative toxin-antitoxin system toxin component, PIN family [Candidatus Woesebacteria bacterium RIFCSPLOWO2_01_FULL_43_11]